MSREHKNGHFNINNLYWVCWYASYQDCNEIDEEAEEDDNDREDNGISSDGDGGGDGSVITDHGIITDCTSEGLGRIHPPYVSIIADYIKILLV